jgi:hypothetical protein
MQLQGGEEEGRHTRFEAEGGGGWSSPRGSDASSKTGDERRTPTVNDALVGSYSTEG